jgi:uncharacterized protein YjbI with pentapeptide repeats
MQDKGVISAEQAEELLKALAGGSADPAENAPEESGNTGAPGAQEGHAEGPQPAGAGGQDEEYRGRRGRRRSGSFFDMGWVDDMVDGITSGLGVRERRGHRERDRGRYTYDYHYEWGSRNAQNSSRVEQPEGEEYEFRGNRAIYSKISALHLIRSKVKDNSFSASSFRDADLIDSVMEDSSLAGASLHELRMEGALIKDLSVAGSKLAKVSLQRGCFLKKTRVAGSPISSLSLEGESRIEDTRLSGTALNGLTLTGKSRIKDCRLNGTTVSHLTMDGTGFSDMRIDGCTIGSSQFTDAEVTGCILRGVSLQDAQIGGCRIKDCRIDATAFSGLRIVKSDLKDVTIRDPFDARPPRTASNLSILYSTLDGVQFIGCTFKDTTLKGIHAKDVRLRGIDLTGKTIERVEDLEALADR